MLSVLCSLAHGAEPLETFRTNLDPLIDRAMRHRTQFAVDVARRIDSESSGIWKIEGENAVWDYSIRIPTAVSMAFHASRLLLPHQGTLILAGGGQTFVYEGRDLHREEFWSRPVKGDQISVRITVPKAMRHQALIEVAAFQAGYRSLAAGIPDNPHYSALKARVSAAAAGCVENYVCDATVSTQNSANASVALVISNKFECSGTLLNNVPQDGTPYVLTARHCENGEDGGGDPGAASSVEIYWNAVTPCGQTLVSIFDASSQVQNGGTTMVEQQDEWLIRLDSQPVNSNAYYAGWDASGSDLVDGYTVDYSGANTQQYVTWAGLAVTLDFSAQDLGVGYATTDWGVVNSLGSIDRGGSGSGLFNSNNLLVGSASRAVLGQCPATPPPVPSKSTAVGLFNKLASTFNSTADASSTTGSATLSSVLDPAHTGAGNMVGVAGPPPTAYLSALESASQTGGSVQLLYSSNSAGAVCTATGGVAGDGWSGVLTAYPDGYFFANETTAGVVTYGLTCVSGSRSSSAQVTVTWTLAPPILSFQAQGGTSALYAGAVNQLFWTSNQTSCLATGGTPGDGWGGALPGSGQANVTENSVGTVLYTITCGTGSQAVSQTLSLNFIAPTASLQLFANPGLRFGQSIALLWHGLGGCTASGGGAGDTWSGPLMGGLNSVSLTEQAAGTYVYTISCGPAAIAATAQVSYTFTGGPPAASITAMQATQLIDLSVEEFPILTWTSNVEPCAIGYTGPVNGDAVSGYPSQGTDTEPQQIAGTYTYTLTCGSGAALATSTATIDWLQQPSPKVTLNTEHGNEFLLSGGYLAWSTNVLPCVGSGGTPGDGWNGTLPYYGGPGNFSAALISETKPGFYTFTITCGVGNTATAQATATYNNLAGGVLMLTPGGTDVVYEGQPALLTWNSSVGPCTGYGGTAGDGWSGPQPQQGSIGLIEPLGFEDYLSLVCGVGSNAVEAQTQVWVYAPATQVYAQLGSSSSSSLTGHPVILNWNGNEAASCIASGGAAADGWSGTLPWAGSTTVAESQPGSVTYGLTCQNGALSGQTSVTVQWLVAPSVTLTSSTQTAVLGAPFTLTWSSANGASNCTASEDGSGGFNGSMVVSGTIAIQESAGTQHTYTIVCSSSYGNVQAQVTVNFSAAAGTGGSGGGGSGSSGSGSSASAGGHSGGGELNIETILLLALLVAMRFPKSSD